MHLYQILTPAHVLWAYIPLLIAGAVAVCVKAQNKTFLIVSILLSIGLAVCALGRIRFPFAAEILLNGALLLFMSRYAGPKEFMPSGFMVMVTASALIALLSMRWF